MPRKGWIHLWEPGGGARAQPGAVAQAAASGEAIGKILDLAAHGLLQSGGAERAAVWVETLLVPEAYFGAVVERGGGRVPGEWNRLDVSLPFFKTLLESGGPVPAELDERPGISMIGPLTGMGSATWVPLRVQERTLGLALVAYSHSRGSGDVRRLLMLADEVALAVAHWRDRELCARQQVELASWRQRGNRAEAELLSLLDSVESGVLVFDTAGSLRWANDRFAQLLGLDAGRITELRSFDRLVEAVAGNFRDPQSFAARWRELQSREEETSWDELELLRPTRKVVERYIRPVRDAARERIGWLEVYRDITSQRQIQSKMLHTEKMAALGQLVSGIAHELNNPLASIMGYAQLLVGRRPGPERRDGARMIYQEAERAGRIVKNLLLFARETKLERRPVDLNEIVQRTLALRSYELKLENITVELGLDPDLPPVLADASQMQQVILNLVVNSEQAIQQGRARGQIWVRTRRVSPQRLALEVADDGPGIPPEIASRVFDPFFTTKPAGVGTGLGLSIVYGIVQEHGGEISLESQPGRGACFLVELPIVAGAAEKSAAAPAVLPTPAEAERPIRKGGERVLVVEDEPTVAQLIADVLGPEGHPVDIVLDSRDGLQRLSMQDYDLVICDLRMPHLDGRSFYRSLVRSGSPLQHRLVFVTGDTLAPHTLEFLSTTGLPYIAKPFLVEELKQAVRRALDSAPSAAPSGDTSAGPPDAVRRP